MLVPIVFASVWYAYTTVRPAVDDFGKLAFAQSSSIASYTLVALISLLLSDTSDEENIVVIANIPVNNTHINTIIF